MSSCRALSTVVLLLLSAGIAARADDGRHHYAAGIVDARAGQYVAAREHFRAAALAGLDIPALSYNLGVVSYHLADVGGLWPTTTSGWLRRPQGSTAQL